MVGGSDDSICCRWDSLGAFYLDPFAGRTAWQGTFDSVGNLENQQWTWSRATPTNSARWFDLQIAEDGGALAVGTIGDTVLFTGTRRISYGTNTPETLRTASRRELIERGGGGGIGIARWHSNGTLDWLRLLRIDFPTTTATTGWQVSQAPGGDIFVTGRLTADSAGFLWQGPDSFPVPKGNSCFTFAMDAAGMDGWLRTLPCPPFESSIHVVRGDWIWETMADSVPGGSRSGIWGDYRGWRPLLVRRDRYQAGLRDQLHPLGAMQGSFRAMAVHENGSILLQGEQASDLDWNGRIIPPRPDTARGYYGMKSIRSSFLLLTDSVGSPLAFQSLAGFANPGAWKIRRIPSRGWLLLGWDEQDIVGWTRLYLLDDSLNVLEVSDTLPSALDVELGPDGRILLTGFAKPRDSSLAWIRGTGSMWAAWCRIGGPSNSVKPSSTLASVAIHVRERKLSFDLTEGRSGVLEIRAPNGSLRFRGRVDSRSAVGLEPGANLCRLLIEGRLEKRVVVGW